MTYLAIKEDGEIIELVRFTKIGELPERFVEGNWSFDHSLFSLIEDAIYEDISEIEAQTYLSKAFNKPALLKAV